MNKVDLHKAAGYEDDFALWSAEQAALLRAGRLDRIDIENIAEEIESLGRSKQDEITSRMAVILRHLLKWQYQASRRSRSWQVSISLSRIEIGKVIDDNPSLRTYPAQRLAKAYKGAPRIAAIETGLPESTFPAECPYTIEEVLSDDFWPDASA